MPEPRKIAILGAGPTGLGAAWRLQELGFDRWELSEAKSHAGGLSASVVDRRGFVWDLGVHVMHSHYADLNRLLDELLPGEWLERVRDASIWLRGRLVPYPVQHNIRHMAQEDQRVCLDGLREAAQTHRDGAPDDFAQWMLQQFGRGLADVFLFPYNRKAWACEPQEMGVQWVGERVAPVDPAEILRSTLEARDKTSWGPNAMFRFPRRGGTGAIWDALFERLDRQRTHLGREAVGIHPAARVIDFADGTTATYDVLISTIPLDRLLALLAEPPELKAAAAKLRRSCLHVVGIGLAGQVPEPLRTRSWIYFPQPELPFHRVTVSSNLSPENTPEPGRQWSLLAEVSERPDRPTDASRVVEDTIDGLRAVGVLGPQADVVSVFHEHLPHAYPTPLKDLDGVLRDILPALEALGIFSRGRFGAWKYQIGNMDHSFMQGVEVVDRVLRGVPEKTLRVHE